jgi:lipid-A-disaccharide synthase
MNREVVKELLQNDLNEQALQQELKALLEDESYREKMHEAYQSLWQGLGNGNASEKAAAAVLELARQTRASS